MAAGDALPWKLLVPPGLALLFGVGALWATCGGDPAPERLAPPPPLATPPGLRRDLALPRPPGVAPQPTPAPVVVSPTPPPVPGEAYPMAGPPPGGGELNPSPQGSLAPGVGPTPPTPPGMGNVDNADEELDVPSLPGRPGHRRPLRRLRSDMD